jgi:membrane protein implicated in regulation of membrane protease activity
VILPRNFAFITGAMDTFTAYSICFGVGVLFTLVSALGAHVFGGHSDATHFDVGHGHAEAGFGSNDMPGFSPLSPSTIAAFIAAFGGFGMIFTRLAATRSPLVSAPLAALGGFAVAGLVFWVLRTVFRQTQSSSEGRIAGLVGMSATVITPIPADGVGEIAYVQSGSRYSAPARAEGGVAVTNGASVKISRIVGTQFYVTAN